MPNYIIRRKASPRKKRNYLRRRRRKKHTTAERARANSRKINELIGSREKKFFISSNLPEVGTDTIDFYRFAQYAAPFGITSGHECWDITPTPGQGVGSSLRSGDSIDMVSAQLRFCVRLKTERIPGGANHYIPAYPVRYKIYIIQSMLDNTTVNHVKDHFLDENPFTNVEDYNSLRDTTHFRDFRVLALVKGKLGGAQAGTDMSTNNDAHHDWQTGMKNQHAVNLNFKNRKSKVNFTPNTQTPQSAQIFVYCVADGLSLENAEQTYDTHLWIQHHAKIYFHDS